MSAPRRLFDDASVPAELRDDLTRVAGAASHYDVEAGLAALQAAVAAGPAPAVDGGAGEGTASAPVAEAVTGGAAAHSAASGASVAAKLGASLAALAVVVTTSFVLWPSSQMDESNSRVRPGLAASEPLPMTMPAHVSAPVPVVVPIAEQAPAPAAIARSESAQVALRAEPRMRQASSTRTDPRLEIEQLGRIKNLLESSPRQAHDLAAAGHTEFPRGALRQEREALAIFALVKLGEHTHAKARAERFLKRYPNSPMRERMQPIAVGGR